MTDQKTFSVREAAEMLELSRAIVSRLCQRGVVGTRFSFPETDQHIYRLTETDVETLRERKKDWEKQKESWQGKNRKKRA